MNVQDVGFFRRLFEGAEVALAALDPDLRVRYWNSTARRIFAPADEVEPVPAASIHFPDLLPEDRRDLAKRLLDHLLRQGGSHSFEMDHRRPDGQTVHLAVVLSPIRTESGVIEGIAAWIGDITEQVHLQRKLAQERRMASLGSLAGGVAHHFNNLLGGVLTTLDYALDCGDPAVCQRVLRLVDDTLTKAIRLSNSLLAFAEGDRRTIDLSDLTETVFCFLDGLEEKLRGKGIALRTHLEAIPVVAVPGPTLFTVLNHLVDNACEAMPNGGSLTVAVRPLKDEAAVEITDNGAGINPADLERVFEPFFTTKDSDRDSGGGHPGLGLAVVHGVIRDLGGRITISSHPGQGTTIQIALRTRPDPGRTPPLA